MNGNGTEWIDENLPIPNFIKYSNKGYDLAWHINGYFGTKKGIEYLNDIIGRVLITFKEYSPKRLIWKPDLKTADHYYPKIYKLKQLQNLKSIPGRKKTPSRADSFADHTFWAIKLYTEDRIRDFGEGNIVAYELIEDWAINQFINKEQSTIRAKCRSIWNWYNNKNWELPKNERKFEMTRTERAKANAQKIKEKAKRKIINTTSGLMAKEYKKANGKWNISKIANELKMSRNTVTKHLKEMGLI